MKHQPLQSITSLPPSPEEERRARMIKYTIMMGIRVACIFALLFAQGWWILVFAAGAVFLPYFAVVVANVTTNRTPPQVERPGGLVPVDRPSTDERGADASDAAAGQKGDEPSHEDRPADDGPEAAR
jgi:hypothetical protein